MHSEATNQTGCPHVAAAAIAAPCEALALPGRPRRQAHKAAQCVPQQRRAAPQARHLGSGAGVRAVGCLRASRRRRRPHARRGGGQGHCAARAALVCGLAGQLGWRRRRGAHLRDWCGSGRSVAAGLGRRAAGRPVQRAGEAGWRVACRTHAAEAALSNRTGGHWNGARRGPPPPVCR